MIQMTISIEPSKLAALNAIVARHNEEAEESITAENYLAARVNEILDSYSTAEVERIKAEAESLFNLAAQLPVEAQEQVKALIQQLALNQWE